METGWRPRGADAIYVCEKCGIVVQPDRDSCPNSPGLSVEITSPDERHPLNKYIREDVAAREMQNSHLDQKIRGLSLQSIEAAEACLEAAKAGLR